MEISEFWHVAIISAAVSLILIAISGEVSVPVAVFLFAFSLAGYGALEAAREATDPRKADYLLIGASALSFAAASFSSGSLFFFMIAKFPIAFAIAPMVSISRRFHAALR